MSIESELLANLQTETRNPRTTEMDLLSPYDLINCLHEENYGIAYAVSDSLFEISEAVRLIADRLARGGRLFYVGAGTSGRLGVLDASECPPTFGVDKDLIQGIIAGGDFALRNSIEGAEDDEESGRSVIETSNVNSSDVVVGIAASGRTPFVIGCLKSARAVGALTIAVVNVKPSSMEDHADITISAVTGPEVLTGSTRLKAGTAQKMILNLISTGVMVLLGKTYGNLMVDVRATNAKLQDRAIRIVMEATGEDYAVAKNALVRSEWSSKTAIVMILRGVSFERAEELLSASGGFVRRAIQ